MPTFAIINGIAQPINITMSTEDDDEMVVLFDFPSFSSLVYDPVFGSDTPVSYLSIVSSDSQSLKINVVASFGFVLFASLIVFML